MTNKITFNLEIDISADCPQSELDRMANHYNVEFHMIEEFGPAGGNPLYNVVSSDIANIKSLFVSEFADDISEYEEIYEPYIDMTIETNVA